MILTYPFSDLEKVLQTLPRINLVYWILKVAHRIPHYILTLAYSSKNGPHHRGREFGRIFFHQDLHSDIFKRHICSVCEGFRGSNNLVKAVESICMLSEHSIGVLLKEQHLLYDLGSSTSGCMNTNGLEAIHLLFGNFLGWKIRKNFIQIIRIHKSRDRPTCTRLASVDPFTSSRIELALIGHFSHKNGQDWLRGRSVIVNLHCLPTARRKTHVNSTRSPRRRYT